MAACGTKRTFVNIWDAEAALQTIRRKPQPDENGNIPIRFYQCRSCSFYHLTHYKLGESNYEKAQAAVLANMRAATKEKERIAQAQPIEQPVTLAPEPKPVAPEPQPSKKVDGRKTSWTPERRAAHGERIRNRPKELKELVSEKIRTRISAARAIRIAEGRGEQEGYTADGRRLPKFTPEQIASRTADLVANNKARAQQARDLQAASDKTYLARLFLERLPLLTLQERQALIQVVG